ncbi:MAG: Hpt domain-containing protein, partial [Desulfobacterales bacterium]|nr:Hpt domain-containing protein [Desulfobacterales bacterium]
MNQVIDFSTLTWVKNELDATLKEARQSLEAHVEDPQDEAQLGFLAAHLHQVYGTLQMVELYGASLLAEEMEQVAKAITDESVSQHDDACEVLMRAILQLPDYLERLIAGYQDIPLVLLPLLNDLRAVRGDHLLSANAMFSPDLGATLPESLRGDTSDGDLQVQARGLRHRFQLGLLGWFREKDVENSLNALSEVLDSLQAHSGDARALRLWWIAAGLAEALCADESETGVAVKRLMGQVDRSIKHLIDEGEAAMAAEVGDDLLKNLLFYVAQAPASASERILSIQSTFRLKELLPSEDELAAAQESLTGQNADLFATVGTAIREELTRLKDKLDIALRSGCKDSEQITPLVESLRSLGDTLGMLSLGAARSAVIAKAEDLQDCVDSETVPPETSLMDVASTLLFVESSVDGMGSGRSVSANGAK